MSTIFSKLVPPISVRGMKLLDRDIFTSIFTVPCFKFGPAKLSDLTPILKKYMLKLKNLKAIQTSGDQTIVYLNPEKIRSINDIDTKDRDLLIKYVKGVEQTEITLKYENWQSDDIFKAVLPEDMEIPTSYSKIGHIIHLNLRDSQLDYKKLIGEVFLDKVSHSRTVVNKLNTIDTTYRHFSMEILAGEEDTVATVKEHGFTYKFDFSRVYWNPRLSTEHANLVTLMNKGDVLYDVFAGVGPFAIPAARKGVAVLANDLNPECHKWLAINATANKVKNLRIFNKDGREFLLNDVKADLNDRRDKKLSGIEHIAMNLPAMACDFLDFLIDWFDRDETVRLCESSPIIHLYCFVKTDKGEEPSRIAKIQVEDKIGCGLTEDCLMSIRYVRNVAPNKEMMRVSFRITESMIRRGEPTRKKLRINIDDGSVIDDDIAGHNGKGQEKRCEEEKCVQSR